MNPRGVLAILKLRPWSLTKLLVADLIAAKGVMGMPAFTVHRVAYADDRQYHQAWRQFHQIGEIGLRAGCILTLTQTDLNPAAAQTEVRGFQVNEGGGNGGIFHPDIRLGWIGADHDRQGGII